MSDKAIGKTYTGLNEVKKTLPSFWYFDPAHFEKEMKAIFQNQWVYLSHGSTFENAGDYQCFTIAGQKIVLIKDDDGNIKAFCNSCRHRGSQLCEGEKGSLKGKSITCPYHQWTYNLEGSLTSTGRMARPDGFDRSNYPLHKVKFKNWRGFLFVNLSEGEAVSFEGISDLGFEVYDNWPLEDMVPVETFTKDLNCNWKIFWENFNECAHCPEIHPELIDMVPLYSRAIMLPEDDKNFLKHTEKSDPKYAGGLKDGAHSWTLTGKPSAPIFEGLSDDEMHEGFRFLTVMPSAFFVAHVDYLRVVRLLPTGPETMQIQTQWFYHKDVVGTDECDPAQSVEFCKLVLNQDGRVAELNQLGLKNAPHKEGVLMPQEYDLHNLHNWIKEQINKSKK